MCGSDTAINSTTVQQHRVCTLESVITAISQLSRFSFSSCGSPIFEVSGYISSVGPLRRLISCIPEPADMDPFVLTHLDFDI